MAVHPTAIVEDGARLGAGVEIGPFCIVGRHAVLGDGVRLISHATVTGHTNVGANCVLHANVVLGGESQIRGNTFAEGKLIVGEGTIFRESATASVGSKGGGGVTSVGANGFFMSYTHIAHDCHIGDGVTFANGVQLAGHVTIEDGAILGGLCAIQQFGRIGRYAFIGGVTGVNEDVIPYGMAIGARAELTGLNLVGLKRRNIPRRNIHALRGAFRTIFQDDRGHLDERARVAGATYADIPEVQEMVQFILAPAKRPICTARKRGPAAGEGDD
jgi:UDP-N-acetylglucosamine acyltransferase